MALQFLRSSSRIHLDQCFSVILSSAIIIGMVVFFLFFSILWLTDRIVLILKSIHSRCPNCKRKSVIPVFICPTCGLEHKKLVPGPYGVFKRKCTCGAMLSTTFIGGRSEYEAHCPFAGQSFFPAVLSNMVFSLSAASELAKPPSWQRFGTSTKIG